MDLTLLLQLGDEKNPGKHSTAPVVIDSKNTTVSEITAAKVCIITTSHQYNDDRIFYKEALSLAKAGYSVSLIARHNKEEWFNSIRIIPLPPSPTRFNRYLGAPIWAFIKSLREKADIYHIHDPELVIVGLILHIFGKRIIYDVHEDYEKKILSKKELRPLNSLAAACWRFFESFSVRYFDHVITADSHVASLFPSSRTSIIANYPPKSFGSIVRNNERSNNHSNLRIVYVGGVTNDRGIGKIVEALEYLPEIPFEFHIAGRLEDPELRKLISQHPRIIYHGFIPWEKVNALLSEADIGLILLQPVPAYLYSPGENIIKLWEYMSVGLSVIISNFPKLKTLIESIDAGIAVDPTDAKAIGQAIKFLFDNPGVRKELGEHGRKTVLERCNWEIEEQKLLNLFQEILTKVRNGTDTEGD